MGCILFREYLAQNPLKQTAAVAITCCLNLRCSLKSLDNICTKKKPVTLNTPLRETLNPFDAPSADLVYPKSIANSGSCDRSSLPWNVACPDQEALVGHWPSDTPHPPHCCPPRLLSVVAVFVFLSLTWAYVKSRRVVNSQKSLAVYTPFKIFPQHLF